MITVLLEKIIQILEGWIQSFSSHAQHVEDKLDSIDSTASDIETNTDPIPDIRDNTGAIITPITQIKTNTDSIKNDVTQIKTDTGIIKNNVNSIATSAGSAAAFAEDCATNTLDIIDKVTTIASDTTQLRADSGNIAADVSSINQALGYYIANTPVTENVEGELCNFDTDMEDYLQKAICIIPADLSGFSSIDIYKKGINFLPNLKYQRTVNHVVVGQDNASYFEIDLPEGTYTFNVELAEGISASLYIQGDTTPSTSLGSTFPRTFTITTHEKYRFQLYRSNGLDVSDVIRFQIESSEYFTSFNTFKEIKNTISLGSTITDGAEIDLLSGIVKINTSPVTYSSITPIAIRTYKGVNNIYSDVGSMSLTYRETLKHYLDKQQ